MSNVSEQKTLSKVRERIQRYNTGSKHALKAVLGDYFPGGCFKAWGEEDGGFLGQKLHDF